MIETIACRLIAAAGFDAAERAYQKHMRNGLWWSPWLARAEALQATANEVYRHAAVLRELPDDWSLR